jgi:hypothetical protein
VHDLPSIFAALDNVREHGALIASATFVTAHGDVVIEAGPLGHAVVAHGERRYLDGEATAA